MIKTHSTHATCIEEKEAGFSLQQKFFNSYKAIFPYKLAAKTIIVIPSLTLDQDILGKIEGHFYYVERLFCLLMLLRMLRTKVMFVTVPIDTSPLILASHINWLFQNILPQNLKLLFPNA